MRVSVGFLAFGLGASVLALPCAADPGSPRPLTQLELDRSFGRAGEVRRAGGGRARADRFAQVAVDSKGRIVVTGERVVRRSRGPIPEVIPLVARFLPDGRSDRRFGSGGAMALPLRGAPTGLVLDASDRPVVIGDFTTRERTDVGAFRLTVRGRLDRSYSQDGLVEKGLVAGTGWNHAARVAEDDGIALAVDTTTLDQVVTRAVVRIDGAGEFAPDWGALGFVVVGADEIRDLAPDASGGVVVATSVGIIRLHSGGLRDTTFGQAGTLTHPAGRAALAPFGGLAVDSEGRIAVLGSRDGALAWALRLLPGGDADLSFGPDGRSPAYDHEVDSDGPEWLSAQFEVRAGRWVTAAPLTGYHVGGIQRTSGIVVRVTEDGTPNDVALLEVPETPVPGAEVSTSVRGMAIAPDGSAAFVTGHTQRGRGHARWSWVPRLLRIDLTPREQPLPPDLAIVWDKAPALRTTPEGAVELTGVLRVTNLGDSVVESAEVHLWLSDDDTFDPDPAVDVPVGAYGLKLPPRRTVALRIRQGLDGGAGRRLVAGVWQWSPVQECETGNNVAVSPALE